MRSSSPAERALGWLVPVLAIVAEGALITVVYVAVQTAVDGRVPLLGTLELSLAAGLAALAVRRGWLQPDEDTLSFLGMLLVLGLAGWLWDDRVRQLLLSGDLLEALAAHPGGWLMVAAAMRGVGRGQEIDDRALTRFVLVGVPALAFPWALGQLGPGGLRSAFTEQAFVASLTFVTTGFIAAGLARLQEIGRETGVDWRRNRSWMATVFGVIIIVLVLGIPASMLLGLPGAMVARGILDPVLTAVTYVILVAMAAGIFVAALIARFLDSVGIRIVPPGSPPTRVLEDLGELQPYTFEELRGVITGVAAVWIVLIVLGVVLLRVWLRSRRDEARPPTREERSIIVPGDLLRPRSRHRSTIRPRRRGAPHDAVTAYLAALDDLARHDASSGRAEHETPRAHARRVEAGPALAALQAGYSLARYGARPLTDAEHRRGLARWRRLRDRLRRAP